MIPTHVQASISGHRLQLEPDRLDSREDFPASCGAGALLEKAGHSPVWPMGGGGVTL